MFSPQVSGINPETYWGGGVNMIRFRVLLSLRTTVNKTASGHYLFEAYTSRQSRNPECTEIASFSYTLLSVFTISFLPLTPLDFNHLLISLVVCGKESWPEFKLARSEDWGVTCSYEKEYGMCSCHPSNQPNPPWTSISIQI